MAEGCIQERAAVFVPGASGDRLANFIKATWERSRRAISVHTL